MKIPELLSVAAGVALLSLVTVGPLFAEQQAPFEKASGKAWEFRVFLDDKEIGFHNFYLAEVGETRQLKSVANFEYNLLFIPVYQYDHENTEIWNGDCLQSISSRTDANGDPFRVDGRRSNGEFLVETRAGEQSLPECVMSFAYWNSSFLDQSMLLNTQDGEFLEVDVQPAVLEDLEVGGTPWPAWRYRLAAGELKMDLWYSDGGEWLGLESEVRGGRTLRYELDGPAYPGGVNRGPGRAALQEGTSTASRKGR